MRLKIGITGGIGVGKSIATRIFNVLNIPTYDADTEAKKLMTEDVHIRQALQSLFGNQVYLSNGNLNRAWLSKEVFSTPDKLTQLNKIVHPVVIKHAEDWADVQVAPYSIKEAALLFESGSYKSLDFSILVTSPSNLRLERVMARDHVSKEEVEGRIAAQMPEDEKAKLADYTIVNDNNHSLIKQIMTLHNLFLHYEKK
ncbi:MAG: dephospho-CoA kinase [Sphingobacterium sp.]